VCRLVAIKRPAQIAAVDVRGEHMHQIQRIIAQYAVLAQYRPGHALGNRRRSGPGAQIDIVRAHRHFRQQSDAQSSAHIGLDDIGVQRRERHIRRERAFGEHPPQYRFWTAGRFIADQRIAGQIAQLRSSVGTVQRMSARYQHQPPPAVQWHRQSGGGRASIGADDGDIRRALPDQGECIILGDGLQVHAHLRPALLDFSHRGREHEARLGVSGAQYQFALVFAALVGGITADVVSLGQHDPCTRNDRLPGGCHRIQAAPLAHEQPTAEFVFQLSELPGQPRLGRVHTSGRQRDVQSGIDNGEQIAQLGQGHDASHYNFLVIRTAAQIISSAPALRSTLVFFRKWAHLMAIHTSILDTIGHTPVIRLNRLPPVGVEVYVKVESFNPGSSVKDRLALAIVLDAEARGLLKPGGTIVEATSGNTGIALAMVAAARGYRFVAVMTETFSIERRKAMRAYGAKVILTPAAERASGMVRKARELAGQHGWFLANQFANPANPAYHRNTTAAEILRDFAGRRLDYFVSGWGTGGTLTGVGEVLKVARPDVRIIAAEPAGAALLAGKQWAAHKIQGWTPDFIPEILNREIYHELHPVEDTRAIAIARRLAAEEGMFVGISAGATAALALDVAARAEPGAVVLAMLPDSGERYFSTPLFADLNEGSDDDWLAGLP